MTRTGTRSRRKVTRTIKTKTTKKPKKKMMKTKTMPSLKRCRARVGFDAERSRSRAAAPRSTISLARSHRRGRFVVGTVPCLYFERKRGTSHLE